MKLLQTIKKQAMRFAFRFATDQNITNEFALRQGSEAIGAKATGIVPEAEVHRAVSLADWVAAINAARNIENPNRKQLYKVYRSALLDLHLAAAWDHRVIRLQATEFRFRDAKGEIDEGAIKILDAPWFREYQRFVMESQSHGYSLPELTEMGSLPVMVETNSGMKKFLPVKTLKLVPRQYVKPEFSVWVKKPEDEPKKGFAYLNPPESNFYLPIGDPFDLGILERITPIILAKRFALAAWTEYNEKIGIPFRWVRMTGTDKKREQLLGSIMKNMGSAGWAVLHPGEEIEFLADSKGDPHKCFYQLCEYLDKQVSKAILGSTMIMDDGSSKSQAEVHSDVADMRYWADIKLFEGYGNEQLIPFLVLHGYPLEGYTIERDDKKELEMKEQVVIDTLLLQYYNLTPLYISNRYGIPEDQISVKETPPPTEPPADPGKPAPPSPNKPKPKPAEPKDPKGNAPQAGAHPEGCGCGCDNVEVTMASDPVPGEARLEQAISDLYQSVFSGEMEGVEIPAEVALARAMSLWDGFAKNLSGSMANPEITSPDHLRLAKFEFNVNRYSVAATLQEWQALNQADKESETFADFEKKAKEITGKITIPHLRTEYNLGINTSQNASAWQKQQEEADLFDLMYDAVMDGSTTEGCRFLNGFTAPVNHPAWGRIYPPNHWGERSEVIQVAKGSRPHTENLPDTSWIKPGFTINRGEENVVFADGQAYLKKQFDTKRLNAKTYGLSEIPVNQLKANLPKEDQQKYGEWWDENQQANRSVYLKNHNGHALELPKQLRSKFDKGRYAGENRQGIAMSILPSILSEPDEVWQSRSGSKGNLQHVYLKRFGEETFACLADDMKAINWFRVEDNRSLNKIRKGILGYRKTKS